MNEKQKSEGQKRYEDYWTKQMAEPEFYTIYEEEAAKKDLWLQLDQARRTNNLTQQEMAERLRDISGKGCPD